MISIRQKGEFKNTERFLTKACNLNYAGILQKYGQQGVAALKANTPIDSGITANSWKYEIVQNGRYFSIEWTNSNIVDGVPIAIILQYGHGTRNGGYVQGVDYINPALKPVFDKISEDVWKEVTNL